jgi:hypothetical protein
MRAAQSSHAASVRSSTLPTNRPESKPAPMPKCPLCKADYSAYFFDISNDASYRQRHIHEDGWCLPPSLSLKPPRPYFLAATRGEAARASSRPDFSAEPSARSSRARGLLAGSISDRSRNFPGSNQHKDAPPSVVHAPLRLQQRQAFYAQLAAIYRTFDRSRVPESEPGCLGVLTTNIIQNFTHHLITLVTLVTP